MVDGDPNPSKVRGNPGRDSLCFLSELLENGQRGEVCVRVSQVGEPQKSRTGWQYRKMVVEDSSMKGEMLIADNKYVEWKFQMGDHLICSTTSKGVDSEGKLTLFFNDFLDPFQSGKLLYQAREANFEARTRSGERMKGEQTVYQISAREAKSLLELIRLWNQEGKPQHYTKWCQMHQIVATNLYYMGLVKRTASMSGYYYPTGEALDFFEGKRKFPKKKVFIRGSDGKHLLVGDEGESKSFEEFLEDYVDRETALKEYREALDSYRRIKASSPSTSGLRS